jgi:hypothetical protein
MVEALVTAMMLIHALIAVMMVWIGITIRGTNLLLVTSWFCISVLTLVLLGKVLP